MTKRLRLLLLLIALAAGLAACGKTTTQTTTTKVTPAPAAGKIINGHRCTPGDEAIQCVLPPAPPPKLRLRGAAPSVTHGVDFAWGAPSVGQMHALGAKFGASYFSYDASKGWTQRRGLVAEYHRAGIATVGVWETSANRAAQGCGAGRADARAAAGQARAVGNTSRPIDFAIDFDASGGQVAAYFSCAHAVLGARANAYGGYYPLKYLCAHGLVGHENWQTYAWSAGQWLPASCAPLEQYLNGSSVDYDRAIGAAYGQWPAPASGRTRAQERAALRTHEHLRAVLHGDIDRHHCRSGAPWHGHAKPRSYHTVCGRWLHHGQREVEVIISYHKRGIY